jgi:hypothetical protein
MKKRREEQALSLSGLLNINDLYKKKEKYLERGTEWKQ